MMTDPAAHEPASTASVWIVIGVLGIIGLTVTMLTAPFAQLMGPGQEAIRGALHGTVAMLFMVTSTIGLFQAYRILGGRAWNVAELQFGSVTNAMLALLTIISGNWVYIPYRSPTGPRNYFLQIAPGVHKVFFEFKEFAALFTFPLAATVAYLLIRYGGDLYRRRELSTIVAGLLVLVFFYLVVAFGLGAAITKVRAV